MRHLHRLLAAWVILACTLNAAMGQHILPRASQGTHRQTSGGDCNYLAVESFAYTNDQPLHQRGGGSGWQTAWVVQNQDTALPGYQTATGQSLGYGDLVTSGNHATGGRAYLTAGRRLNTDPDGPFADFITPERPYIGGNTESDELWVSMLLQKNNDNDDELAIDLHSNEIVTCPQCPGTQRIAVGYFGAASTMNGQRRWSLAVNETILYTDVLVVPNEPVFIALSFRFLGDQTEIAMYTNPTGLGNASPNDPQVAYMMGATLELRSLSFYAGPNPGDGAIDEIRFATTYPCVAPNPEVVINEPPVALATATPTAGDAPLAVTFDGTASYDPDGSPLTYRWDFGDGTPLADGPQVSHTYTTGGGEYAATLTVLDPQGATGSVTLPILVRIANEDVPCLSRITADAQADCSGQGGSITVHTEPNTQATLRWNGQPIAATSGNRYTQLQAGVYTLEVTGDNGCADQYDLHVRVDSTTCAGWTPDACAMPIGTNLNGFADWVPQRPLKNFLKNTRGEPIPYTDGCDCWSFDDPAAVLAQMQMDENGYPLSIPQTTSEGATRLRFFTSAAGENMPPNATYVLLYDGIGIVTLHGQVNIFDNQLGRIRFELGGDGTFWFQIIQSQLGDHVRNIRILRVEDEFADLDADPFYDVFLERIAPFQNLRFMDWMATNNNPVRTWSERKPRGYYTYGGDTGVPYELIIQLANQTQKDVWICVPHAADDDYVRQMAQLFKDGLDADITIYLEYSNEVWNWIFDQAHYNVENNPLDLMYGRAMADKARRTFRLWHEVFGDEACRVQRVVGIQAGFNYLNEHILAHIPQDEWDYGSPTHYFGLDHGETGQPRLDVLGSSATVMDIMDNARHHFAAFAPSVRQDYRNIQAYGKEVITYEGGQHFVGNVFGIPYDYQQAMWDAQNTMLMYELYDDVLDSIRQWGCRLASNFSLVGPQESIYGSWGVLDQIALEGPFATTAPKYQVHLDNMPADACIAARRAALLSCLSPNQTDDAAGTTVGTSPFRVYPNPGTDQVVLDFPDATGITYLYNLTGQLLLRTTERQLDVAHLPAGLYLLRHGRNVVKWVKGR